MKIQLKILSSSEIFLGLKFSITKMVEDITTYTKDKKYPKMYILEIGLIFISIEIYKKGSI